MVGIFRASLLLSGIMVFQNRIHGRVLGNSANIDFSLAFRFLRLFMYYASVRSIRGDPIRIGPSISNLIVSPVIFYGLSNNANLAFGVVRISNVSNERVRYERMSYVPWHYVILTSLFLIVSSTRQMVILRSFLRALFRYRSLLHLHDEG